MRPAIDCCRRNTGGYLTSPAQRFRQRASAGPHLDRSAGRKLGVAGAQPAAAKLWSQQAHDKFASCNFAPGVTGRIEVRIAVNGSVSSIGSLSYCWANWFVTAGPPVPLCFRPLARLFPASDYRIVPFLPGHLAAESIHMPSASRRHGAQRTRSGLVQRNQTHYAGSGLEPSAWSTAHSVWAWPVPVRAGKGHVYGSEVRGCV
jgi:hypothetical protein